MDDTTRPRAELRQLEPKIRDAIAEYDTIATSELERRTAALDEIIPMMHQHDHLEDVAALRPRRGWIALMSRGCGPLPDLAVPTMDEFSDVPRRRWLAAVMVATAIALIIAVQQLLPAARVSPVSLAASATGISAIAQWVPTIAVAGFFVFFVVVLSRIPGGLKAGIFRAAMAEEVIFRLGCETWTGRQRVLSCAGFGVAHLLNLVVAFLTLGVLALAGAGFMAAYLVEFRRSGDPRRAVWASARLHADYNTAVLIVAAVMLAALAVAMIFVALG